MTGWLKSWWHELLMAALAVTTIWLALLPETRGRSVAIETIWGVFVLEYAVRFARAPAKLKFVRGNLPDLLAIAPSGLLRGARLFRLLRLLRMVRYLPSTGCGGAW
jgi:voltage-gated potassium channel